MLLTSASASGRPLSHPRASHLFPAEPSGPGTTPLTLLRQRGLRALTSEDRAPGEKSEFPREPVSRFTNHSPPHPQVPRGNAGGPVRGRLSCQRVKRQQRDRSRSVFGQKAAAISREAAPWATQWRRSDREDGERWPCKNQKSRGQATGRAVSTEHGPSRDTWEVGLGPELLGRWLTIEENCFGPLAETIHGEGT